MFDEENKFYNFSHNLALFVIDTYFIDLEWTQMTNKYGHYYKKTIYFTNKLTYMYKCLLI